MMISSSTSATLLLLFLCSLLSLSSSAPAVVTIVDFTSWSFRGEIAGFANPLDEDYAYTSSLMTPPDDPRMCEFPSSLLNDNNTTISVELRTPVAMLISLGGCDPIDKVNIALKIQREVTKALRYLVFYNNDPDDPDEIPSLRESDFFGLEDDYQSFAVVAVSTSVGSAMLGRIEQLKDVTSANPQFLQSGNDRWQLPMVLELISDRYPTRGAGYTPTRSATANFLWFRFVLFTLLIISPCCRAGYLWWAGGGRIRLRRNENGMIIGLQYIPPMTYWFASNGGSEGGPQITDRLTEDEVLALPEILYKAPKDEDDDDNNNNNIHNNADHNTNHNNTDDDDTDSDGHTEDSPLADSSSCDPASLSGDEVDIVVSAGSDDAEQETETPEVIGPAEEDPTKSVNQQQQQKKQSSSSSQDDDNNNNNQEREYVTTCTACSICIDEFEEGERIRLLPRCNHAFHTECIMPWLTERQGCCPLCKVSVIEIPEEEEEDGEGRREEDAESPPAARGSEEALAVAPTTTMPPENASLADRVAALSRLARSIETDQSEEVVVDYVEPEIDPVTAVKPIEDAEIRLAASSLSTDGDLDDDDEYSGGGNGNDEEDTAPEVLLAEDSSAKMEVVLESSVATELESPIEKMATEERVLTNGEDAESVKTEEEITSDGEKSDSDDCKKEEVVEEAMQPTIDSEGESLDIKISSSSKEEHPFDEHPHDESDPSIMDVPFDECPRDLEASATVWLKAVEDTKSSGDSSKSLSP